VLLILTIVVWFLVFCWLVSLVLTVYGLARRQTLRSAADSPASTTDSPLVSILIPARNEEHRVLTECVRSILAQDYERFEVIAVNDRSTDRTPAILETIATGDERLRVIEGEELPAGWLGKPYAMQQAVHLARGEWILATDADMIFDRTALRSAMDHVLKAKGDAMTLIPHFDAHSFWERVMIPTWCWVFLMFAIFFRISNPKSQGAAGIGGFFLMRREVLDRIGGYAALKDEVIEDVRLAEMIKRSGARLFTEHAPALLRTRMYSNFREMWECSTKNWFAGMWFSLPFALSCVLSMYGMAVVPPVIALSSVIAIAAGGSSNLWLLFTPALTSWLLQVLVLAIVSKRNDVSPVYALTAPLGLGSLYAMLFDSSVRITTGRGVTWKGRKIYERSGVRPPRITTSARPVTNVEK
jgi:chlorobactene glucosyltransferase